jgi:CcmD family protein
MSEWSYVVAAFGLTWAVLTGYLAYLSGRLSRARAALRDTQEEWEVGR